METDLIFQEIEIEKDIWKVLKKYCDREDISINYFIRANLEAVGEI